MLPFPNNLTYSSNHIFPCFSWNESFPHIQAMPEKVIIYLFQACMQQKCVTQAIHINDSLYLSVFSFNLSVQQSKSLVIGWNNNPILHKLSEVLRLKNINFHWPVLIYILYWPQCILEKRAQRKLPEFQRMMPLYREGVLHDSETVSQKDEKPYAAGLIN